MTTLEAEGQTSQSFKSNVEDLALDELTRLQAERDALLAQAAVINKSITEVKAVLKAVIPDTVKRQKAQKIKPAFTMSAGRTEIVVAWIQSLDPATEITTRMAADQFPEWSESFCHGALKVMREQGYLRLAATTGQALIYRRMG